jgi:hypothetical protein
MKTTHEQLRVLAEAVRPDVVIELLDQLDIQAGGIEAVQATNQRLAAEPGCVGGFGVNPRL